MYDGMKEDKKKGSNDDFLHGWSLCFFGLLLIDNQDSRCRHGETATPF